MFLSVLLAGIIMVVMWWLHTAINYETARGKALNPMISASHFCVVVATMILTKALL